MNVFSQFIWNHSYFMHVARMHVASFLKVEEGNLIQKILTRNKKKVLYSRNLEYLHPWGWVRGKVSGAKKVSSAYNFNFDLTFYFLIFFFVSYMLGGGDGGDHITIEFYIQYVYLRKMSSASEAPPPPACALFVNVYVEYPCLLTMWS